MGVTFQALPLDIHFTLSRYLAPSSFTALSRTNRFLQSIYEPLLYTEAAYTVRKFLSTNHGYSTDTNGETDPLFYDVEKIGCYLGHLATTSAIRTFFEAFGTNDEYHFALMILAEISTIHNLKGGTRYDVIEEVILPRVLSRRTEPSAERHWGRILWTAMIEEDNLELLAFLSNHGLDVTLPIYIFEQRRLPINEVAVKGSVEMLRFFVDNGANLNGIDHLNMTPLSRLAAETENVEKQHMEMAYRKTQILVEAGAHAGGILATRHPLAELWRNLIIRSVLVTPSWETTRDLEV